MNGDRLKLDCDWRRVAENDAKHRPADEVDRPLQCLVPDPTERLEDVANLKVSRDGRDLEGIRGDAAVPRESGRDTLGRGLGRVYLEERSHQKRPMTRTSTLEGVKFMCGD